MVGISERLIGYRKLVVIHIKMFGVKALFGIGFHEARWEILKRKRLLQPPVQYLSTLRITHQPQATVAVGLGYFRASVRR